MIKLTEAEIQGLDDNQLYHVLTWARDEIARRAQGGFAELVRESLRDDPRFAAMPGGGAVRIVFVTREYDNGWFYSGDNAELTMADGSVEGQVSIGDGAAYDALTEMSAIARGDDGLTGLSQLVVDLVTGSVSHE